MRAFVRVILVACFGGLLMLVAHVGAFLSSAYAPSLHLPYWWAYLLLYPPIAVIAVWRGRLPPLSVAAAVCLLPAVYFLALGVLESSWTASDTAILGVGLTIMVTTLAAIWAGRRQHDPRPTP